MSVAPHIAIIGAGLIGLSSADALARRGARVRIFDARPGPCEGASFSNSGMIHPSQALSWAALPGDDLARSAARAVHDLALRSRAAIRDTQMRLDLADDLSRAPGCAQIFPSLDAARAAADICRAVGVAADIRMDPVATLDHPALWFAGDNSGDARAYGVALAAALARTGVETIYGVADLGLRAHADGMSLRWRSDGGQDRAAFDHVVVAAGVGSTELLSGLGLRLPVRAVRGWAMDFARPDTLDLPDTPVMDSVSRSALSLFPGRVRLSGLWDAPSPDALPTLWDAIRPGLSAALGQPLRVWSGLRPVSDAGRPYISPTSVPGLWLNTGHGHMGWTLCAGSGELLAGMMLDGQDDLRFAFAG